VFILVSFFMINSELGAEKGPFIIHFDSQNRADVIGGSESVYGILGVAGVMAVINLFLANVIYDREKYLAYVLACVTLIIAILTLVIIWKIVSVN
jgi:hypothetical protein